MIEATVSLAYFRRLKAQLAVNLASLSRTLWLAFIPACGVLYMAYLGPASDWPDYLVACFLISAVPFEMFFRAYQGTVKARKNGPFVYSFDPDGFGLKTRNAQLRLSWAGVPRVRTKLGFLLVYPNKKCAYTVPLESFSADQVQAIFSWAREGGVKQAAA